jgi:hypothetical protein
MIMPKCNFVTCGCTTVQSFFESEGGKWSTAQRLQQCHVAFSMGMSCVSVQWYSTVKTGTHMVEVKVNLSLNSMNAYEGEWSAECHVERIHSTHWIGSWFYPGAGLDRLEKRRQDLCLLGIKLWFLSCPAFTWHYTDWALLAAWTYIYIYLTKCLWQKREGVRSPCFFTWKSLSLIPPKHW